VVDRNGRVASVLTRNGHEAHFTPTGHVATIRTANGMMIAHRANGSRSIITEHRDAGGHFQSRIVSTGRNRGYVDHSFQRGGHEYMRRTYVYGGRTHVAVYRGYYYRGVPYYHYVPAYYYGPSFYGWAYHPWVAPLPYAWGWAGSPWYGWYGYYWAPYPVYVSPAYWMTDYIIAENLRAAYEARATADSTDSENQVGSQQQGQNAPVSLSPEVKEMIAEEVKTQLAAEQAAASQTATSPSTPTQPDQMRSPLDPSLRIFIVTTSLDINANGESCSLAPGDVLMRTDTKDPDEQATVGVSVVSSQRADCGAGSVARVQVADLLEMHNHFREQMDQGLKTLADNQAKGLPQAPAAGARTNSEANSAPDLTAENDLSKQQVEADQAEKEVQQASAPSGGGQD